MKVEGVDCISTRKSHEIFVNLKNEINVIIVDFPEVGDNLDVGFCESAIQDVDLVLWLIHSGDRDYDFGLDFHLAVVK